MLSSNDVIANPANGTTSILDPLVKRYTELVISVSKILLNISFALPDRNSVPTPSVILTCTKDERLILTSITQGGGRDR